MATIKVSDDRLNSFYNQNPDFDILKFNLTNGEADNLNWDNLERETTLELLKKYQKSISLDSAHAIAALPETQFVQDFSKKFREENVDGEELGVDVEQVARTIYQNATAIKANVSHLVANLHSQVASPHTRAMKVNNVGSDIHKFEDFPSYQELFGTLNYCECEHCRSIFSAAAYFVDLMRIVEQNITQPNDKDLKLEYRRPDLAKIELTCENTNHQIPYLQIVNERLTYLVNTLLDRDPNSVPFATLANQNYPFNLPFNLPLTQIRTYLAQLKTSLFDIYNIFGVDEKEVAREYLELSHQEYQLITTSSAQDSQALGNSYGVDNFTDAEIKTLSNVDNFLARTGLTLDELNQLLYQNLSKAEIDAGMCHQFFINRGLNPNDYLQISPDFNKITHRNSDPLDRDPLDRINRFVRLAKKLNWSFADLDWVLRAISNDNPKIDDSSNTIVKIAKIKQIAKKYKLKLEVVCSFFYDLKNVGDNNPYQTFFDNETAPKASRIAAGLRISFDDLTALRIAFFSNSNNEEEIDLTVENLSVFYRHAQLATIAKLPIKQYLILWRLINKKTQRFTVEDITEILDLVTWLRNSGFNVYELDYILNGTESKYVGKWDKEEDIRRFLESLWTIKIKPQPEKKKEELIEHLATFLGSSTDIVEALMELVTKTIPDGVPDYIEAFLEKPQDLNNNPNSDYIKQFLSSLSKWLIITQKIKLNQAEIDSICNYPSLYGIPEDFSQISIDNLKSIYTLKQLTKAFNDPQNELIQVLAEFPNGKLFKITGWEEAQIFELGEVLQETSINSNINSNNFNVVEKIAKFKQIFDLNKSLGANISFWKKVLSLLNVTEGRSLRDWVNSMEVAQSILHLVKAKYNDGDWEKVSEKFDSQLNELKRNVLAYFALRKLNQQDDSIKNLHNLSEYLLIDVETTGCASISYIKQAILSLQMYLQRCRMSLEPGVTQVNIPEVWWQWIMNYRIWEANRKVFLYPENYIDPSLRHTKTSLFQELESELLQSDITQDSVEQAYQNYFNKFAELAQLKPAASYRCTIEKPNSSESQDTLFLFGRTAIEPYTYYYQECINPTVNKPTWTAWNKVDLTINSDYINVTYAFNKLFIFWVEISKTKKTIGQEDGKTIKKNETKATIKYSFHKVGKQWIQPQTLAKDIVIEDYDESNPQGNLWHKVCALPIPGNESEEKILTLFGNFKIYSSPHSFGSIADVQTTLTSNLLPENIGVFLKNQPSDGFRSVIFNSQLQAIATRNFLYDNYNDESKKGYLLEGLVGYWPMNDGYGKTIQDKSNYENQSAFQGNPQWTKVNDFPGADSRYVLEFDGEHDYISFDSSNVPVGNKPYTIAAWIKPYELIGSRGIVGWGDYGNDNQVNGLQLRDYQIYHYWWGNDLVNNKHLEKNKWYHLAATFDGTIRKIFLDGNEVAYDQPSGQHNVTKNDNLTIGYQGWRYNLHFKGQIAEVGIWEVALSSELIGFASKPLPLIPLITTSISQAHSYAKTINNQPGWFTFENGDEAFLVIPQKHDFKKISDNLEVNPQGNGDLILSYSDSSAIFSLSKLKFAFTRLTTSTIRQLNEKMLMGGLDHLLTLDSQLTPELDFTRFSSTDSVIAPNSKRLDFDGPYGIYFWEIFFHIPFLVANTLNANQKFEEAQKWYNYIFNPTTQEKGPVGYWPMDDGKGTIIKDKSNYDNKGAFQGNPQWKKVNDFPGADSRDVLEFDGKDDYISFESSNVPNVPLGNENYTIAAWIKPNEMGDRGIVDWGNYGVKNEVNALRLRDENGIGIRHEWWNHDLDYSVDLTDGWHHVAATFDGTTRKVFLDGKEVAKDQPSGHNVTEKNNLIIGRWNSDGYFKGQIAEVGIWNVALSAKQMKNLSGNNTAEQMKNLSENNTNGRFWRYLPFRGHTLEKLKGILTDEQAIQAYNNNPVDPHAIARLRIGAYEKAIVMKYIDNLLDWGDKLFAEDTWESITQATMLYLLAYDLLGQKPEDLGKIKSPEQKNFDDIKEQYKALPEFPWSTLDMVCVQVKLNL